MKRRHEDAELKAANDTVLEGMDWYFWVARARGLIELSQTTKNVLFFFGWASLGIYGAHIYIYIHNLITWTDFPDTKKCQEDVQVLCFGIVFASMGHDQQNHQKKIMAKCQFHERLWGQSCICSKEKDPQSATHFLVFYRLWRLLVKISNKQKQIVSQLKNTLGHLRLWQSIARRWTQRLLFQRHMIGEEIELFRYAQRNGYYPL